MRGREKAYGHREPEGASLKGGEVHDGEVKRQNSETSPFPPGGKVKDTLIY